ncbi:MAG TPA: hypothetical protein VJ673_16510, partial [Aromatoleum sp.]|uniref:hypothetical protein n=1 Tax=Aromatoleum sp. TaxID=2307007 RepID=UPI002B49F8B8
SVVQFFKEPLPKQRERDSDKLPCRRQVLLCFLFPSTPPRSTLFPLPAAAAFAGNVAKRGGLYRAPSGRQALRGILFAARSQWIANAGGGT